MRRWVPRVRKKVRALELSNSRAVVTLHGFNIGTELCSHIREEVRESVIRVRLET
jgi:hypothetical protein